MIKRLSGNVQMMAGLGFVFMKGKKIKKQGVNDEEKGITGKRQKRMRKNRSMVSTIMTIKDDDINTAAGLVEIDDISAISGKERKAVRSATTRTNKIIDVLKDMLIINFLKRIRNSIEKVGII